MIDPPDCKSPRPMNSTLLSRRNRLVLLAFRLPCHQPNTSHLAQLVLAEAHEHSPPTRSHSLPTVCSPNLELPFANTKPIDSRHPAGGLAQ